MDLAVGGLHALRHLGPFVDGKHDTGGVRADRVEQRDRGFERRTSEAGARERGTARHRCFEHEAEHDSTLAKLRRQIHRAVEDHGRDAGQPRIRQQLQERHRVGLATSLGRLAIRREIGVGDRAERFDEPRMDLGLGQRSGRRREQRTPEMEVVAREVEVEERRLGLLELRRGREDVVREPRGLGHRDVDHDQRVERGHRLAHPLRIGERVRGIRGLDDHRAIALGVIREDLVGDHVARHEPADDPSAGDGADVLGLAVTDVDEHRRDEVRARLAEATGQCDQQAMQVADQRGLVVHLHTEILEARERARLADRPSRAANQ